MRTDKQTTTSFSNDGRRQFLVMAALLFATLGVLFFRSFLPGQAHFNNDTPLGFVKPLVDNGLSDALGRWGDRNSVGGPMMTPLPDVTNATLYGLGAVGFAKFYAPLALLVLGLCAWAFFRALKLTPLACVLGGLVAALNSGFFATACWGVASQPIAFGMCYLALAAVVSTSGPVWARLGLAGLAVGMGVMEAADIGAIFSLFVAAFVVFHALVAEGVSLPKRLTTGTLQVAVVALFAGWMAFGTVSDLVGTQIQGVAGMRETAEAKAARWDWATQWSLPKREILGVAVPGLFGFRMDSSQHGLPGGDYWGAAGRDPAWDRYFASGEKGPPPGGFLRYGGGGGYMGVLVVLVVIWAAAQALRRQGSAFSTSTRKFLWFWLGIMVLSLLLAFGRHAPFYWLVYQLPYFSTIRNPSKFGHILTWAMVVVFAYGVHGLSRRYLETAAAPAGLAQHLRAWWSRVRGFDRKWTLGCLAALAVSLLGWLVYASNRTHLESYLQTVQFDADNARAIASFSIEHVGWFVLRLLIAVGLVTLALSGWFAGTRARWGGVCLGVFLAGDLALANRPWTIFWDYPQKYATNPIIEQLRDKPYEHRVAGLPRVFMESWFLQQLQVDRRLAGAEQYFRQLYGIEWTQQLFQYYNIQCLDIVQMPRVPADLSAFDAALGQASSLQDFFRLTARKWQLTNTRYLLGAVGWLDLLNQGLDPQGHRFRVATRFDITSKPDVAQATSLTELTAEPSTNGTWALFEFTGALPRAGLYTHWQKAAQDPATVKQFLPASSNTNEWAALKAAGTNDFLTLKELASPAFDPAQTVLVADSPALSPSTLNPQPSTNANSGTVDFLSYNSKDIVLRARAAAPSVLLLNDKYDPNWKVTVDEHPQPLLRCNYLMRGVQVPAGEHRVEFRYAPPASGLYVSLSALAVALALIASLLFLNPNRTKLVPAPGPGSPSSVASGERKPGV